VSYTKTGQFAGEFAHRPPGAPVAVRTPVVRRVVPGEPYSLDDGLGIRRIQSDGRTHTEVLELTPALAAQPVVEQAIRGRASRYADLDIRSFAPVRRVERAGGSLHIVSEMPAGVRLSHLLAHLEATGEVVPESAAIELSSLVINAIASLHAWPGGLAHGAINPAHVLLTNDGRIMLTDCVFGAGLEVLQRNREVLWKEFALAMPAAASLARFDQQADVAQMGALILAVILQRPLRAHEYPRGVTDLVVTATESSTMPGTPGSASALRMWLQEALQIHPRLAFRSAVEAQRSFADISNTPGSTPGSRRSGAMALQVLLRTTCGEPLNQPPVVVNTPMQPASNAPSASPAPPEERRSPFDSIIRSVFHKH
jgi:hypothetical protein